MNRPGATWGPGRREHFIDGRLLLLTLCLLVACPTCAGEGGGTVHLHIDPSLEHLEAEACHDEPVRLRLLDERGRDHVRDLRFIPEGGIERAVSRQRTLQLPAGCLRWRFEFARAVREEPAARVRRIGDAVALSPNLFLHADETEPQTRTIELLLPDGVGASVPWTPLDTDGRGAGLYRFVAGPRGWQPLVVFGEFEQRRISVGGTELRLAVLAGDPPADPEVIVDWIATAARSVTTVTGSFPVPSPQVLVVPVVGSLVMGDREPGGPVPFARVLRDGGAALQFFIDQRRGPAALDADWTAPHEFAHLLLPFIEHPDAWISEGFASYYQNVLRARAGQLTEREAWQKLAEGFDRGRRADYEQTLHASITEGGDNRTMRLYWTGAAVALLADVRLRRAGIEGGLDSVLARLAHCCLPADRAWSGRELFARLDALSGNDIFRSLYDEIVDSTLFPDVSEAWAALGVEPGGKKLRLADDVETRVLRRAIMTPPGAHAAAAGGTPEPQSG